MIIRNAVPPIILATILGFVSAVAADAKPITEAEKNTALAPTILWRVRLRERGASLMPCAPMEPLQLKQADAVEAAIDDELIALRVGPFL